MKYFIKLREFDRFTIELKICGDISEVISTIRLVPVFIVMRHTAGLLLMERLQRSEGCRKEHTEHPVEDESSLERSTTYEKIEKPGR